MMKSYHRGKYRLQPGRRKRELERFKLIFTKEYIITFANGSTIKAKRISESAFGLTYGIDFGFGKDITVIDNIGAHINNVINGD